MNLILRLLIIIPNCSLVSILSCYPDCKLQKRQSLKPSTVFPMTLTLLLGWCPNNIFETCVLSSKGTAHVSKEEWNFFVQFIWLPFHKLWKWRMSLLTSMRAYKEQNRLDRITFWCSCTDYWLLLPMLYWLLSYTCLHIHC